MSAPTILILRGRHRRQGMSWELAGSGRRFGSRRHARHCFGRHCLFLAVDPRRAAVFGIWRVRLGSRIARRTHALVALAPQFVRPLRLFIPVRSRSGGLISHARRFLGLKSRQKPGRSPRPRRAVVDRTIGLWLYDAFARDPLLPRRLLYKAKSLEFRGLPLDAKYRWLYSFSDAQDRVPREIHSGAAGRRPRNIAAANRADFRVFTYHRAVRAGRAIRIAPIANPDEISLEFEPAAIVNATGAWVDRTLAALDVPSPRLMGGTNGSHFITHHAALRERLAGRASTWKPPTAGRCSCSRFAMRRLSAPRMSRSKATRPRPSPRPGTCLSDRRHQRSVPRLHFHRSGISLHYSGVRPLPAGKPGAPATITRRHWLEEHPGADVPFYSVIGGKLTTCRSLAESAAATILKRLGACRWRLRATARCPAPKILLWNPPRKPPTSKSWRQSSHSPSPRLKRSML